MQKIDMKAYAKINIGLDVLAKREDGYHDIKTLMHNISLSDTLSFSKSDNTLIHSNKPCLKNDESNIIYRCIKAMRLYYNIKDSLEVTLTKKIPMQAGLGGGSTDGAASMFAFCKLYNLEFNPKELTEIASKIGADIPFFLYGGICLCEGIGEKIIKLAPALNYNCLIIKPKLAISSKDAYDFIDDKKNIVNCDFNKIIDGLNRKDDINNFINNDFEIYADNLSSEISSVKNILLKNNSIAAGLSGSGSALYGIFDKETDMNKAKQEIQNNIGNIEIFDCKLTDKSFEII